MLLHIKEKWNNQREILWAPSNIRTHYVRVLPSCNRINYKNNIILSSSCPMRSWAARYWWWPSLTTTDFPNTMSLERWRCPWKPLTLDDLLRNGRTWRVQIKRRWCAETHQIMLERDHLSRFVWNDFYRAQTFTESAESLSFHAVI